MDLRLSRAKPTFVVRRVWLSPRLGLRKTIPQNQTMLSALRQTFRTTTATTTNDDDGVDDSRTKVLENELLLENILSFLPDSFCYVGVVNRTFHSCAAKPPITSYKIAVTNPRTAQYWVEDDWYTAKRMLCSKAAKYGRLETLKWAALSYACFRVWQVPAAAAEANDMDMLKWARKIGCPWDESTCANAAFHGNLEILHYARSQGCRWDESTCSAAAGRGHLETLQWAHDNGCRWNEWTCAAASGNGFLETLKWLREHGCPWDENTLHYAELNDHVEVAAWARANGCR